MELYNKFVMFCYENNIWKVFSWISIIGCLLIYAGIGYKDKHKKTRTREIAINKIQKRQKPLNKNMSFIIYTKSSGEKITINYKYPEIPKTRVLDPYTASFEIKVLERFAESQAKYVPENEKLSITTQNNESCDLSVASLIPLIQNKNQKASM